MAKYNITYSCGHDGIVELFGPMKERERKIKWLESAAVCPDCYKAQQAEELAAWEEELGLPALSGSEKQIKWARDLRQGIIKRCYASIPPEKNKKVKAVGLFYKWLYGHNTAKWWINNREVLDFLNPLQVLGPMCKKDGGFGDLVK